MKFKMISFEKLIRVLYLSTPRRQVTAEVVGEEREAGPDEGEGGEVEGGEALAEDEDGEDELAGGAR